MKCEIWETRERRGWGVLLFLTTGGVVYGITMSSKIYNGSLASSVTMQENLLLDMPKFQSSHIPLDNI